MPANLQTAIRAGAKVRNEADRHKFFEASSKKGKTIAMLSGMAYIFLGIFLTTAVETPASILLIILGFNVIIRFKAQQTLGLWQ